MKVEICSIQNLLEDVAIFDANKKDIEKRIREINSSSETELLPKNYKIEKYINLEGYPNEEPFKTWKEKQEKVCKAENNFLDLSDLPESYRRNYQYLEEKYNRLKSIIQSIARNSNCNDELLQCFIDSI